ncbi:hypothetical protein [Bacillus paranthracis]|uniref:hypothetical protein n=1 Tax=Bacillus paranthracis TaxID=2026186 RepID=UPI0013D26CF0|nr:hypothetical protein [Bacillus paranthracis]QRH08110.1 hypothetical protein JQJ56_09840 [Bacillus paranthracis]
MYKEQLMIVADLLKIINKERNDKEMKHKVIKERIDKIYNFFRNEIELANIKLNNQERKIYNLYIKDIEKKKFRVYTGIIYLFLLNIYENDRDFFKFLKYIHVDEASYEAWMNACNEQIPLYIDEVLNIHYDKYFKHIKKGEKKLNSALWKQQWLENQEIEFNDLLIYFRGIIYQLWKSNADRLLDIINNEETEIDKILEKVKGLPEFRRYKFYKKFSKSLNETFYAEINSMKYELKKAMYSYDKKEILRISSDLWRLNTICFPKIGIEEEEVFFIYLQNILWNSTYSKLLVGDVLSEFKNYFLMLEQNQKNQ